MYITIRDELGVIMYDIDGVFGVAINDGACYFTDVDGTDHTIPVDRVIEIREG